MLVTDILFENNNNGIGMPATSSLDQELPTGKVPRFKAYFYGKHKDMEARKNEKEYQKQHDNKNNGDRTCNSSICNIRSR